MWTIWKHYFFFLYEYTRIKSNKKHGKFINHDIGLSASFENSSKRLETAARKRESHFLSFLADISSPSNSYTKMPIHTAKLYEVFRNSEVISSAESFCNVIFDKSVTRSTDNGKINFYYDRPPDADRSLIDSVADRLTNKNVLN